MKINIKYGIFLVGALSLIMLSALALSDSHDNIKLTNTPTRDSGISANTPTRDSGISANTPTRDSGISANDTNQPITIPISSEIITYTHEDLNNYSDTVITGTVKNILPSKWNTVDGKKPNKALTDLDVHDLIYTDVVVSVDKYLKNPLSSKEIIVKTIGGTVGNITMKSDDEPSFTPGEKVLLYLSKDTNPDIKNFGSEHFVVTGFLQGKFTLTDNGEAKAFNDNTTLNELVSTIKK